MVRDRDAVRKARRPARILQIGDRLSVRLRQRRLGRRAGREFGPVDPLGPREARRLCRHRPQFGREDQHLRIAAGQLDAQLLDIGIAPAERGRQRQRHRPGAHIDGAEEQRGEFRHGLCDQRDPVLGLHARGDQAIRHRDRVGAQLGERIGAGERTARIVEVETAHAAGRVIQRLAQRREIGKATRQFVQRRRWRGRRRRRRLLGHRLILFTRRNARPCRRRNVIAETSSW